MEKIQEKLYNISGEIMYAGLYGILIRKYLKEGIYNGYFDVCGWNTSL